MCYHETFSLLRNFCEFWKQSANEDSQRSVLTMLPSFKARIAHRVPRSSSQSTPFSRQSPQKLSSGDLWESLGQQCPLARSAAACIQWRKLAQLRPYPLYGPLSLDLGSKSSLTLMRIITFNLLRSFFRRRTFWMNNNNEYHSFQFQAHVDFIHSQTWISFTIYLIDMVN